MERYITNRLGFFLMALIFLAIVGNFRLYAQENPKPIQLPSEIDRILRDYEEHWQNADETKLSSLFTVDGYILRPNKPIVQGRDNIEKAYENSGGRLVLEAYDYAVNGDTGYIIGGYKGHENWPAIGKFILTLRKEDGKWMITADMDNSNADN